MFAIINANARVLAAGAACLTFCAVHAAPAEPALRCATGREAPQALVAAEYGFKLKAQTSIKEAFLEYLAEDSLVLRPDLRLGRAFYTSAADTQGRLDWYPTIADTSGSDDLGFTLGPWTYTAPAGATQVRGSFLTVWKRDAKCRWRVALDGGVTHAPPASTPPALSASQVPQDPIHAPASIADDPAGQAVADFHGTAHQDGIAAGLRTFGRNAGFRLLADNEAPMELGEANEYLTHHARMEIWQEAARGRAADSTLLYAVGELVDGKKQATHTYVEIWQYDPKVANWGLRILLINALSKSPPAVRLMNGESRRHKIGTRHELLIAHLHE